MCLAFHCRGWDNSSSPHPPPRARHPSDEGFINTNINFLFHSSTTLQTSLCVLTFSKHYNHHINVETLGNYSPASYNSYWETEIMRISQERSQWGCIYNCQHHFISYLLSLKQQPKRRKVSNAEFNSYEVESKTLLLLGTFKINI